MDDVVSVMAEGDSHRSVAATAMNAHSSRSHSILLVGIAELLLNMLAFFGFKVNPY